MSGRCILILAPHPDDEVVGFAALARRHQSEGATVAALFLTDGIPDAETLWPWRRRGRPDRVAVRRGEAEGAAAAMGTTIAGFLGLASRRLKDHLAEARAAVAEAISRHHIDTLWVPAFEGGHQDHDAASALASTFKNQLAVFEAALYHAENGRVVDQVFQDGEGPVYPLSPPESAAKRELLALYASERGNLDYVGVSRESLRPQAAHDYTRPPCSGPLFYQRFQWVPFPHPRVDFTRPEQVGAALARFLSVAQRP